MTLTVRFTIGVAADRQDLHLHIHSNTISLSLMCSARTNHVVQLLQDPGLSVQEDSSGSDTAPCPPATQQLKLFMYHRALYAAGDWESGGEGTQRFGTPASLHRIRDSRPGRQQPPCIWFACGYTHVAVVRIPYMSC